ncbi:response regulator [Allochromatium humboldtianum]|nr:response regulator [Allochromatium humboldtianum]
MIVEDDPATGALLRQLVKRIWPQAVVTLDADPLLALDRWQEQGADLILLDWELPGMSGLEILKTIRRSGIKTICVMITSHSDRDEILAARAFHVDAYIIKPFDAKQIMERLSQLIDTDVQSDGSTESESFESLDAFIENRLKQNLIGLPIAPEIVERIARIRDMEAPERIGLLRECRLEPALLFRMLSLANSSRYIDGMDVVETFEEAIRKIGLDAFINLAVEVSLHPGSHIADECLARKRFEIRRSLMSLVGILVKLREHLEFNLDSCRTACILHSVAELSLLQLMQTWIEAGHTIDETTRDSILDRYAPPARERLQAQWLIPNTIRERIEALDRLPTGTVRKEPIIMRITALLHAGDPQHELPRLMARFGLSGKIDAVSTGSES